MNDPDLQQLFIDCCQQRPLSRRQQQRLPELEAMGFDLNQNIVPIDQPQIQQAIPHSNIITVFSTASTQTQVPPDSTLIAEHQSHGQGRQGKNWLTPLGHAICLSARFIMPLPTAQLGGYQLTVAIAILQTIKHFNPHAPIKLKWPNDLYHQDAKCAGILIQLNPKTSQSVEVTAGIGINWQLNQQQQGQVEQKIDNIPIDTNRISRNQFIIKLLQQIEQNNQIFCHHGIATLLPLWQQHDFLRQKTIAVTNQAKTLKGLYLGINNNGALQLMHNRQTKTIISATVRVVEG